MEQKLNALILSCCLAMSPVSGADSCDVTPIKKGSVAPCDGFFFNKDAEAQAEQYRDDANFYKRYSDALKQKSDLQANENDVLQKRLNLYIQESSALAKDKVSKDTTEDIIRIGYFSLGVLITTLIVRNVRQ